MSQTAVLAAMQRSCDPCEGTRKLLVHILELPIQRPIFLEPHDCWHASEKYSGPLSLIDTLYSTASLLFLAVRRMTKMTRARGVPWRTQGAAVCYISQPLTYGCLSARSYSDDLEEPKKSMAMTTTATPAIVSSGSDPSDTDAHPGRHDPHHDEESLIPHLAAAFRKLDLATNVSINSRRKLPFLRRVLQKGFHGFCEQQGISTTREPPHLPVEVQYRIEVQQTPPSPGSDSDSDEENERNISSGPVIEAKHSTMSSWRCPLCSHLGELHSRDMLMFHLTRDHPNTQTSWEQCGQTEVRMLGLVGFIH